MPLHKTLGQFDLKFQPSINERQIRELATLAFIPGASNILFLGPLGVGKTHRTVARGLTAIGAGHGAYLVRSYDLLGISDGLRWSTGSTDACGSTWP